MKIIKNISVYTDHQSYIVTYHVETLFGSINIPVPMEHFTGYLNDEDLVYMLSKKIFQCIQDEIYSVLIEDFDSLHETIKSYNTPTEFKPLNDGGFIKPGQLPFKPDPGKADLSGLAGKLKEVIPELGSWIEGCPAKNCVENREVYGLIMHLNDQHAWTREAIADWLETLDIDLSFKVKEYNHEQS